MSMEKEKRLFLASALAMVFLYGWSKYFVKPPTAQTTPEVNTVGTPSTTAPAVVTGQASVPTASGTVAAPVIPVGETFETQSKDLKVTWSTSGGGPVFVRLNHYQTELDPKSSSVEVFPFNQKDKSPWNFSLIVDGQNLSDQFVLFTKEVNENAGVQTIKFSGALSNDLKLVKTFEVDSSKPYAIRSNVSVFNTSALEKSVQANWTLSAAIPPQKKRGFKDYLGSRDPNQITFSGVVGDKSFHQPAGAAFKKPENGLIEWLGLDSHYFLSAIVPVKGSFENFDVSQDASSESVLKAGYSTWLIKPGATVDVSADLYSGPKEGAALRAVKPTLEKAIDLGDWLGVIARPIQKLLRGIHAVIPNYGIAIILLTVLVRLAMWPLSRMQMSSMKKMQEHKPYLDELKEKFGEDREGYSRAMMSYMKTHKINPMGGCLLLLPQLPVFFSLYRVIFNTVELRHAPFFGWIQDLSAHDPFFVLPVLLGVAMFYQQKLTPSPGVDPAQQAVMKFMPIMFTSFMLFLPAGLNLYILVSTLWGVSQQVWMHKQMPQSLVVQRKASNS